MQKSFAEEKTRKEKPGKFVAFKGHAVYLSGENFCEEVFFRDKSVSKEIIENHRVILKNCCDCGELFEMYLGEFKSGRRKCKVCKRKHNEISIRIVKVSCGV